MQLNKQTIYQNTLIRKQCYLPNNGVRIPNPVFRILNFHFYPRLGPHKVFHNLPHPPCIRVTMATLQRF